MKQVKKIDIIFLVLFFVPLVFWGCKKAPQIDRSTHAKIYVEITIAQSKYANLPDSLRIAKDKIYSKYNVTEDVYHSVIKSIEPKAEYWDGFYKDVRAYLDSLKRSGTFE